MKKVFVEICSSCLKACELIQDRSEGANFLNKVAEQLPQGVRDHLQLELGQCQRFCPDQRVTVTAGLDPAGSDRRLGASKTGDMASLCLHIETRVQSYQDK